MIARIESFIRRLRHGLSRTRILKRVFRFPESSDTPGEAGIILIQIDGLSRTQFQKALDSNCLPFLKSLLEKEDYRVHTFFSGVPSSTPAVQGELHYGVRNTVPSFSFRDHHAGRIFKMYNHEDALEIEQRIQDHAQPLLKGGSSYSNIYSGGSDESRFCVTTFEIDRFLGRIFSIRFLALTLLNIVSLARIMVLAFIELALAVSDFFRGIGTGQNLFQELKFVPTRVGVCIVLRELLTIGARIDALRGLPIIHQNFLGYDEQAHRRGPSSAFAHWTLKGIDYAIKRIWTTARLSPNRDYDLWVYSDHGQEETLPFLSHAGRTLEEAVSSVVEIGDLQAKPVHHERTGIQLQRIRLLKFSWLKVLTPREHQHHDAAQPPLAAMGPLGQIYLDHGISLKRLEQIAQRLIEKAKIPLVLWLDGNNKVQAHTSEGRFELPRDAAAVLGRDHPLLDRVAEDLIAICRHPSAGQLIISGWRPHAKAISFPVENGSHAGPGIEETRGFALLPSDCPEPVADNEVIRPLDLRRAALHFLGREEHHKQPPSISLSRESTLRIMTYNVHSCIGMDGKISPHRIARVIARYKPHVIALQEIDVSRPRTGCCDQAGIIARHLRMEHRFYASLRIEEEQYGNAILSCLPIEEIFAESLPARKGAEPRSVFCAKVSLEDDTGLYILNTHLGLHPMESNLQASFLEGPGVLGRFQGEKPLILCGDFNSPPRSNVHRVLNGYLRDAQLLMENHRPRNTWFSRIPFTRIDHIFLSHHFEVTGLQVPDTDLVRTASDHLPLIAEIKLK